MKIRTPRIGRVPIARGRDAADVPIRSASGPNILQRLKVRTEALSDPRLDGQYGRAGAPLQDGQQPGQCRRGAQVAA